MAIVRMGQRSSVQLSQVVDRFIGLKFIGMTQAIEMTIPANKATKEAARTTNEPRVRANLIEFSDDGSTSVLHGEILVLSGIKEDVVARPNDWLLGVYTKVPQVSDPSRTVYAFTSPTGDDPDAAWENAEAQLRERSLV